jgi:hypothetical protein
MENLAGTILGFLLSAFGAAWKVERHFDRRVDEIQLKQSETLASQRVSEAKTEGKLDLLGMTIEASIARNDERFLRMARDLRDVQAWLAKHHRYPVPDRRGQGSRGDDEN